MDKNDIAFLVVIYATILIGPAIILKGYGIKEYTFMVLCLILLMGMPFTFIVWYGNKHKQMEINGNPNAFVIGK